MSNTPSAALLLCENFLLTSTQLTASLNRALGGVHGIGATDLLILRALSENPSMRRVDLAQALGMSPSGISRAIRPLEKRGLLHSTRDPHDARASRTTLTDAGRNCLLHATETANQKAQHLLGRLYPDEVATLQRLMERMR